MKTLRKRIAPILCAALLGCAAVFPASADVLIEPEDNFYEKNADDCVYLGERIYYANGWDGALDCCKSPASARVVREFPNGAELRIRFSYTDADGAEWGVVEDGERGVGWVRLADTIRKYDSALFLEEHADALTEFVDEGDYERLTAAEGGIAVWTYPGSGEVKWTIDQFEGGPDSFGFQQAYTDENGLRWGYCGYYFGMRENWICLDDPTADDLPVNETLAALPALRQPREKNPNPAPQAPSRELLLAGALVAAVVGVTAVLLALLYRRREK